MSFDEIVAAVIVWTKRPDLLSATYSAIRGVTLKYHRRHKFFKDLKFVNITNPTPSVGVLVLDISSNFPQWRQFAAINYGGTTVPFKEAFANDLLDADGYAKTNIFLVAGTSLNLKGNLGLSSIDVTYFSDPILGLSDGTGYSSWIANEQPDLIIAAAAARVLAFDNESEIYKAATAEATEQFATLVESNLEAQGR